MSGFQTYGAFTRRIAFTLLTACVIAAIVIQNHTTTLPLGVFNTGADTLAQVADGCLIAAAVILLAQLIELFTGHLSGFCGLVRGAYVSLIILNVLLVFGDRIFVTGNPAGKLGQYYEVPGSGHPPVMLKKDFTGRALAPCLADSDSTRGPSILFLGDSYTEGSGSSPECNYPDVVQRVLQAQWMAGTRVIHAGVSGYGPVEALSLLRWYRARGCPLNAIVYNLTLQNDFADNLPNTERRVVAGIIFRYPRDLFLRAFHPLNTRVFRWALVLAFFGRASTQDMLNAVSVPGGPCDLSTPALIDLSPFLRMTARRDLETNARVAACPDGYIEAQNAVAGMREIAHELNVPFFLVVFPDRVLVDSELQTLLGNPNLDASQKNHSIATELATTGVIDMVPPLAGRPGMYRTVDTHLSDAGNVVAGEYVGNVLAKSLGGSDQ